MPFILYIKRCLCVVYYVYATQTCTTFNFKVTQLAGCIFFNKYAADTKLFSRDAFGCNAELLFVWL